MPVTIASSVGRNGTNAPADVLTIKARLVELGLSFVTPGPQSDNSLVRAIQLFQAMKNGTTKLLVPQNDGRVDVNGDTIKWLNAANAPRWVLMPAGSPEGGMVNDNLAALNDDHDFGSSWIAETLTATGLGYRAEFLDSHPGAALLHINDTSLPQGGDTSAHAEHETGLQSDVRLPRKDGGVGGITVNQQAYDRNVMRAMLKAFLKQPLARRVFLNDDVLINEGLCRHAGGHDNHAHFEIKPPPRVDQD
ncbi:MAG TPA: hypothetical protein VN476_08365 [Pyrinomonadaceae bacterium]|nr:hypothetical protein [Pyrinomonadaceae bacterium]